MTTPETTIAQLHEIFDCLTCLEQIQDKRSHSTLDLIEALEITKTIIQQRTSEGIDDYKNDYNNQYINILTSIKQEIKLAIHGHFSSKGTLRFVSHFNNLTLDKFFVLLQQIGASSTDQIAPLLIDTFINKISEIDVYKVSPQQAQEMLIEMKNNDKFSRLEDVKHQRINIIRRACEKNNEIQEST